MRHLSRMLSRLAALALLAIVLGAVWQFVIEPVAAHVQNVEESIVHNRQFVDRLTRSISRSSGQDARIEDLRKRIATSNHFLRAGTGPLAAAEMRKRLMGVIGQSNVDVKSFQALAGSEKHGLPRVSARAVLQGEFEALIEAFYRLETEQPYLFIEDLRIKMAATRLSGRNRNQPTKLSVVFQLTGYLPPKVEP